MAEEQDKAQGGGGRRFRLPRLFADAGDEAAEEPVTPAAPVVSPTARRLLPQEDGAPDLQQLRDGLERVFDLLQDMNQRESAHERVFDTLHQELTDYKKDFIYEHLKPVVRPLLFLYDSMEQFDAELTQHELPAEREKRSSLPPRLVRQNVDYFREQLVEALRVCEVTIMDQPRGELVPKLHKVVEVVPADAGQGNQIQRVVRSGWYLNGQLLRPAEVVVGKAR